MLRLLLCYLKPVLPGLTEKAEAFLNIHKLLWRDVDSLLTNHRINKFQALITRVEPDKIAAMIDAKAHTKRPLPPQRRSLRASDLIRGLRNS